MTATTPAADSTAPTDDRLSPDAEAKTSRPDDGGYPDGPAAQDPAADRSRGDGSEPGRSATGGPYGTGSYGSAGSTTADGG